MDETIATLVGAGIALLGVWLNSWTTLRAKRVERENAKLDAALSAARELLRLRPEGTGPAESDAVSDARATAKIAIALLNDPELRTRADRALGYLNLCGSWDASARAAGGHMEGGYRGSSGLSDGPRER